ncbi:MAG: hypothetical protein K6B46_02730 [Opitutales bacterium]|nr:hypothetical protein [Opitutales bacterium]
MKKIICTLTAVAILLAGTAFAFSQEEGKEKIPNIGQVNMKWSTGTPTGFNPQYKWGCTTVEFAALPNADFQAGSWLTNLKCTLTLVYKKSAASMSATKARGSKGKEAVAAAKKEQGDVKSADYTTYRATVTFAAVEVSGSKNAIQFFIPGEILKRDKEHMSGQAKPEFAYVEFSYGDLAIGAFDKDGKLRQGFLDGGATAKKISKLSDFEILTDEIADPGAPETRGLLLPYYMVPGALPLKNTPSVVRSEIEQQ